MADTTLSKLRDTESTNLSDDKLSQYISDAQVMIAAQGWQTAIDDFNNNNPEDIEEPIQRYLTLHLAKINEHEISSESTEGKSQDFNTPEGDIMEFLSNTRAGRRVKSLLSSIGVTPTQSNRSMPATY